MMFRFTARLTCAYLRRAHRRLRNLCPTIDRVSRKYYGPGRRIFAGDCVPVGVGEDMDTGSGSSPPYVRDQHRRLLLRSAKSVAARVEREHQWSAETAL